MDIVRRQNTCNANGPSSYSAFASLKDDILIEILCRLPSKSIHRFMCVSKHWFSIISDSYFIQRFRSTHPQPPPFALLIKCNDRSKHQDVLKLLLTSKDSEFQSQGFSLSFLPCFEPDERNPVKIIASCNGLLLCCAVTDVCPTVYYICNPLTKQWFALPPVYHRNKKAQAGLICENNRYKVVCMVNVCNYGIFDYSTVKIFSSETGKWKETIHKYQIRGIPRWISFDDQAIVCDGMLYWWSLYGGGFITCDPSNGNQKLCFDCYPEGVTVGFDERAGVCKGRFCLGHLSSESPNDLVTLRVWLLEDCDRNKWCLRHEVPWNELKSEETELVEYAKYTDPEEHPFQLLCFHPYNEDIIYMNGPDCVVSCNMETKTLEVVPSNNIFYRYLDPAYPFELPWWPSPIPSSTNLSATDTISV